jgi:phosphoribosylformylglycinamidine cyclo-ligase
VSAIIHVTGGGVPANLLRVLKRVGLGAELDALFTPQREFFALQEFGRIDDREAYRTWNMGQCALIITPNAEIVLRLARDQGLKAKLAGKVTRSRNITLHSMALNEEKLVFKT